MWRAGGSRARPVPRVLARQGRASVGACRPVRTASRCAARPPGTPPARRSRYATGRWPGQGRRRPIGTPARPAPPRRGTGWRWGARRAPSIGVVVPVLGVVIPGPFADAEPREGGGCLVVPAVVQRDAGVGERREHYRASRATSTARRVLPTPLRPTSVTSRASPTIASTAARSRSRPTKLVHGAGSPTTAAGEVAAGASAASSRRSRRRICAAGTARGSRPCAPRYAAGPRSVPCSGARPRHRAPRPHALTSRPARPPHRPIIAATRAISASSVVNPRWPMMPRHLASAPASR